MDTQYIMARNSKVLRDFFAGIASGNYYNGMSYQLYLDLDDDTIDIKVEASDNTWSQRDDGSLVKLTSVSGYDDTPEAECYTNGCDLNDYGFAEWLDSIEKIIDSLEE